MNTIRHVEVVVPARNEQDHLGVCLRSLLRTVEHLGVTRPAVTCGITIVLDGCTDRSAELLRYSCARTLTIDAGCVGTARREGIADALSRAALAGHEEAEIWIANTDADTIVPRTWLDTQLRFAEDGADAVIGTATPIGVSAGTYRQWRAHYHLTENHPHIHGANLGVRVSAYLRAGGFRDEHSDEDVDLVARIRRLSTQWVATHQTNVRTSGRPQSRVQGGFASYVAALEVP